MTLRKNPRQITKSQLAKLRETMGEFGDLSGITYHSEERRYLSGNQRMAVIGQAEPVIERTFDAPQPDGTISRGYIMYQGNRFEYRAVSGWSAEKSEMAMLIANHAGGSDDWDELSSWGPDILKSCGFDEEALKVLSRDFGGLTNLLESEKEAGAGDGEPGEIPADRFEEVQKKWQTADGQRWQVGRHTVICGDSLTFDLSTLNKPGIVIADPPYGVNIVAANGYVGGGEAYKIPFGGRKGNVGGASAHIAKTGMTYMESNRRKGFGSADASKPFGSKDVRGSVGAAHIVEVGKYPTVIGDENTNTAKDAARKYIDAYPDVIQVWWGANYYIDALTPSMCWLVWNKETTGNFADCELAWTNMEKAARLFTHRWNGMLRASEHEKRWHPTQKPAALPAWILEEFTEQGAVLIDPFGGAGWTLLAAEMTGRTAQVIEKSAEYVAVQLERFSILYPGIEITRLD